MSKCFKLVLTNSIDSVQTGSVCRREEYLMPVSAKQILNLLESRVQNDDRQFYSIALQIAAAEARAGHRDTAEKIRSSVDRARSKNGQLAAVAIPIAAPRGDLKGLLDHRETRLRLTDVVLGEQLSDALANLVLQQRRRDWLKEHGQVPNSRFLFVGPPGSGKTLSAEAVAGELNLPFYVIRMDTLITRYMGETASKLRVVFDEIGQRRGVYFFDEFDALGGRRAANNDVAEMRRVLNAFLMYLEEPSGVDSLVLAATNHGNLLDPALMRRFDDILQFKLPDGPEMKAIIKSRIKSLRYPKIRWADVVETAEGLSQAEIAKAATEALKTAILDQRGTISTDDLVNELERRQAMRESFEDDNTKQSILQTKN